jgi:hypothetical protein
VSRHGTPDHARNDQMEPGSAGRAGATANLKLTFHLDHSAGADQSSRLLFR